MAKVDKNIIIHSDREGFPYQGTTLAVHLLRYLSLVYGAITVLATYLLSLEVFSERRMLALGAAVLTAFNPAFIFTSSAVTNDGLLTALSSLALLLSVLLVTRGPSYARYVGLGAVVGLAAVTKLTGLGFYLPLFWIVMPIFAFADYPLRPVPYTGGILCLALGHWIFHRSHADLGTNWSVTLETRENHQLVTEGIYRHVRHPMYLAFLLYSLGQVLVIPNWVVGPFFGAVYGLLIALRVGPEERMLLDEFDKDYEAYMTRTKRLVPGVW